MRIGELEARLEMDREFEFDPEKRELVPVDIPPEERSFDHDGIACRDATIMLHEEAITRSRARIASLETALKPAEAMAEILAAEMVGLKSAQDAGLRGLKDTPRTLAIKQALADFAAHRAMVKAEKEQGE
jgi:hypothetical protein